MPRTQSRPVVVAWVRDVIHLVAVVQAPAVFVTILVVQPPWGWVALAPSYAIACLSLYGCSRVVGQARQASVTLDVPRGAASISEAVEQEESPVRKSA